MKKHTDTKKVIRLAIIFVLIAVAWSVANAKAPITVLVIDSGIMPHKDLTKFVTYDNSIEYEEGYKIEDRYGHGTHIAGLIVYGNDVKDKKDVVCDEVKLISCKSFNFKGDGIEESLDPVKRCFRLAIESEIPIDVINFSGGGVSFIREEYELIKKLDKKHIKMFFAAGNNSKNLYIQPFYPAMYGERHAIINPKDKSDILLIGPLKNTVIVGNGIKTDYTVLVSKLSNFGVKSMIWMNGDNVLSTMPGDLYGKMTGTSMSTALATHSFLKQLCKRRK